ncbi:response regulator [Desulfoplanes formicivorans]|uniref:Chemotaxis protein CheY n=1 Tax=Desulfoplanes formicivorans TaxID=1592317 RepID=A0A194AGG7_9BACT|nr:response regulator [Desulfoplanes formicivorans]GAU09167.1 chemotaxis protein CheY [Desulfoplanes formicivorans]
MERDFSVLIVDDEDDFRSTLIKRLAKRKIDIAGASGGEEALAMMRENPRDIVVLDVKMPGMDGIETLTAIKKQHPLTEVIMLTGHANIEAALEGMEFGAFDYLMKPTDIDDLLFKLEDAYHKRLLHERKTLQLKKEAERKKMTT